VSGKYIALFWSSTRQAQHIGNVLEARSLRQHVRRGAIAKFEARLPQAQAR
jgi:hypothetical protein